MWWHCLDILLGGNVFRHYGAMGVGMVVAKTFNYFGVASIPKGVPGHITSTVMERQSGDLKIPVRRRVYLLDALSKRVVQVTVSDPITGAYSFTNLVAGKKYDAVSYDHTHLKQAVIADNLTAEPMP